MRQIRGCAPQGEEPLQGLDLEMAHPSGTTAGNFIPILGILFYKSLKSYAWKCFPIRVTTFSYVVNQ